MKAKECFKGTANDAYRSMTKIKQIAQLGHAGILSIPGSPYAYTTVFQVGSHLLQIILQCRNSADSANATKVAK